MAAITVEDNADVARHGALSDLPQEPTLIEVVKGAQHHTSIPR